MTPQQTEPMQTEPMQPERIAAALDCDWQFKLTRKRSLKIIKGNKP